MPSIRVWLKERSYPIFVGRGLFADTGRLLKKLPMKLRIALVVSQKEIAYYYQERLFTALSQEGFEPFSFITPSARSSEASKSQQVYFKLIKNIALRDHRGGTLFLIALGGGVIGDLAGFAASVYRRGIPYVQIPTTLTAQVDSAIGGKTGVDLPEGKNLLGTIYQPILVLSDIELLSSLPERHWNDGFAEVIKYGVIRDPWLFSILERHGSQSLRADPRLLEKVICRCARIKAKIVEKDEFDKKEIRRVLNFGHTAGHALEAASSFSNQYTHGQAVAVGMLIACDIARKLGVLKEASLIERLEKSLIKFDLPVYFKGLALDPILKAMGYDKKSEAGVNCFVLPVALGKTALVRDVPLSVIAEALRKRKG